MWSLPEHCLFVDGSSKGRSGSTLTYDFITPWPSKVNLIKCWVNVFHFYTKIRPHVMNTTSKWISTYRHCQRVEIRLLHVTSARGVERVAKKCRVRCLHIEITISKKLFTGIKIINEHFFFSYQIIVNLFIYDASRFTDQLNIFTRTS